MDLIAFAVLLLVGTFLLLTNVSIYQQYRQGDTLVYGGATLVFSTVLTVAYYTSLIILAF